MDILPSYWGAGGVSGDLKARYGTFKNNSALQKANQVLVGGSLYLVLSKDWSLGNVVADEIWPRLTETYYHPIENHGTAGLDLPQGIKANYLQTEFSTGLGLGPQNNAAGAAPAYPVSFDITYDGSQPTSGNDRAWQSLWKLQLSTTLLKKWAGNVQPTVTYTTGKNGGFDYDKQVLIGILVKLFDPEQTGS